MQNQQSNSHLLDTSRRTSWSLGSCSRICVLSSPPPFRVTMLKECIIHEMLSSFQTHLCSCQGSARHQIKVTKLSRDNLEFDLSPASYQPKFNTSLNLRMTGSWDRQRTHPNHTPKSLNSNIEAGDHVRSVEVRRLELLTSCLQSRRSTN